MSDQSAPPSKQDNSVAMRERRKKAGVIQVNFYIRAADKQEAAKAMRDLTDRAWLSLYDAGAVVNGANEARAEDIRRRLGLKDTTANPQPDLKKGVSK
ncbi:hypothetical protein [Devosia sp.]|uniref:hypothetical protein n=1 Tax=Devosia sp. TaxID=1871048 RepID=UPI0019DE1426|nr:hypothetical protein [Devosia sp.]MBE0580159.1 hypothetical protein [Devosia sp.]